jgi:hypothetical protein
LRSGSNSEKAAEAAGFTKANGTLGEMFGVVQFLVKIKINNVRAILPRLWHNYFLTPIFKKLVTKQLA